MKKYTVLKWPSALVLTLAMVLSMAAPAMASNGGESGYTVTIDPQYNISLSTPAGVSDEEDETVKGELEALEARYQALQIFKYDTDVLTASEQTGDEGVKWGDAVDTEDAGLQSRLSSWLGASDTDTGSDSIIDAAVVANALISASEAQDFAALLSEKDDNGEYRYLNVSDGGKSTWNETDLVWEISGLESGYYMIRDTYAGSNAPELLVSVIDDGTTTYPKGGESSLTALPGTGGMGDYLFYISGCVLLLGAAFYLICSHEKEKKCKPDA